MTWHPTTNRIQFCHLTPEERAALEAWPHGWEFFYFESWNNVDNPEWARNSVYRGKPAPVVTSVWFNRYRDTMAGPYRTQEDADAAAWTSRIDVLRIDTCNGVSTAHLEGLE